MKRLFLILSAVGASATLAACLSDTTGPRCQTLPTAVTATRGDTVTTETGLRYLELRAGSGAQALSCRPVTVAYTGSLSTGEQFDTGTFPFVPGEGGVIPGFEQGVVGMRVGGRRRLIIPPALGYGGQTVRDQQTGQVRIPPNSTLIFDIELRSVD